MEKLNELCLNLENYLDEIANISKFELVCNFCISDFLPKSDEGKATTNKFDNLKNIKGLYIFDVKNGNGNHKEWIDEFTKKFRGLGEEEKFFLHKFTPNVIEKRKYAHSEINPDWIPMYLGKSKNIKSRIFDHLFSTLNFPPFALKLFERLDLEKKHVFLENNFRVRVMRFENMSNSVYNLVASNLETRVRNEIKPIIGKQ